MREAVVLVHGIWSNGMEMWRLRQHLSRAGYECHIFKYNIWGKSPADIASRLHTYVDKMDAPVVHFLGHSFGGIVLLHMFDQFPFTRKGRIVLMGAPVNGSMVGRRLHRVPLTRWTLGKTTEQGLLGDVPEWKGWQDIGIIAGTFPLGAGLVAGGPEMPHDGTVAVEETRLKGATDFIALPVSHTGMLLSTRVATQVITFLRSGKFGDVVGTPLLDTGLA
jgi:pimeloyl-ACP methyl ester carboxylesterase